MNRAEQIAARLQAATPGPWTAEPVGIDDIEVVGPPAVQLQTFSIADGTLIANAPTDLAYLLKRVAELEAWQAEAVRWLFDEDGGVAVERLTAELSKHGGGNGPS